MTYKLNNQQTEVKITFAGNEYHFWIHGVGLIPLHQKKCIADDRTVVYFLKKELRNAGIMEGELKW